MFDPATTQVLTGIGFFGFVTCIFYIIAVKKRNGGTNGNGKTAPLTINESAIARMGIICMDVLIGLCCLNVFLYRHLFIVFFPRIDLGFMNAPVQVIGFSLLVAGDILLFSAYKALGIYWAYPLDGKTGKHKLIVNGPYAYIRHPVYVSFNLIAMGFVMVLLDWIVLVLYVIGAIGLYTQSVLEEKALLAYFGEEYRVYMARTGRFFHDKKAALRGKKKGT